MPEVESHSYLVRRSQSMVWNVSAVNRTPWDKVLQGRRGKKWAFISTSCFHSELRRGKGMVRGGSMAKIAGRPQWRRGLRCSGGKTRRATRMGGKQCGNGMAVAQTSKEDLTLIDR